MPTSSTKTKAKSAQTDLFPKKSSSYGGVLMKKRKGRIGARPLSTTQSMHLVLRSTKAIGEKSFKTNKNSKKIQTIIDTFARKYGIQILSLANAGNHLHFHLKITKRAGYVRFIRAITSAIAMYITGINRWTAKDKNPETLSQTFNPLNKKFWDYRPFTRIVIGKQDFLNMKDYIQINQLEGLGIKRIFAKVMIQNHKIYSSG